MNRSKEQTKELAKILYDFASNTSDEEAARLARGFLGQLGEDMLRRSVIEELERLAARVDGIDRRHLPEHTHGDLDYLSFRIRVTADTVGKR